MILLNDAYLASEIFVVTQGIKKKLDHKVTDTSPVSQTLSRESHVGHQINLSWLHFDPMRSREKLRQMQKHAPWMVIKILKKSIFIKEQPAALTKVDLF